MVVTLGDLITYSPGKMSNVQLMMSSKRLSNTASSLITHIYVAHHDVKQRNLVKVTKVSCPNNSHFEILVAIATE
jgi:hypothetical protein